MDGKQARKTGQAILSILPFSTVHYLYMINPRFKRLENTICIANIVGFIALIRRALINLHYDVMLLSHLSHCH